MTTYNVGFTEQWTGDPVSYELEWSTHDDANCTQKHPEDSSCMCWDSCKGFVWKYDRVPNLDEAEKLYRKILKHKHLFHHPHILKHELQPDGRYMGKATYRWEPIPGEDKYECSELFDEGGEA